MEGEVTFTEAQLVTNSSCSQCSTSQLVSHSRKLSSVSAIKAFAKSLCRSEMRCLYDLKHEVESSETRLMDEDPLLLQIKI